MTKLSSRAALGAFLLALTAVGCASRAAPFHVDNPTGDCSAPDSGGRFGVHSPDEDDVWVLDCENPRSREYYRVLATAPDRAYVMPRPDGSTGLAPVCADPQHALRAVADRYTLCSGAVDVELVNAMTVDDALANELYGIGVTELALAERRGIDVGR